MKIKKIYKNVVSIKLLKSATFKITFILCGSLHFLLKTKSTTTIFNIRTITKLLLKILWVAKLVFQTLFFKKLWNEFFIQKLEIIQILKTHNRQEGQKRKKVQN